jgi:hypothetical protein
MFVHANHLDSHIKLGVMFFYINLECIQCEANETIVSSRLGSFRGFCSEDILPGAKVSQWFKVPAIPAGRSF